jgi:Lar family restriction alleviation protein
MAELKPCPFCGGTEELGITHFELDERMTFVICGDCQCEGPVGFSEEEAEKLWNRRADNG